MLRNVQWSVDTGAATCAHVQRNGGGSEVNLLFLYGRERIGCQNGMATTTCETTTKYKPISSSVGPALCGAVGLVYSR